MSERSKNTGTRIKFDDHTRLALSRIQDQLTDGVIRELEERISIDFMYLQNYRRQPARANRRFLQKVLHVTAKLRKLLREIDFDCVICSSSSMSMHSSVSEFLEKLHARSEDAEQLVRIEKAAVKLQTLLQQLDITISRSVGAEINLLGWQVCLEAHDFLTRLDSFQLILQSALERKASSGNKTTDPMLLYLVAGVADVMTKHCIPLEPKWKFEEIVETLFGLIQEKRKTGNQAGDTKSVRHAIYMSRNLFPITIETEPE